jgi:hypothetical protein
MTLTLLRSKIESPCWKWDFMDLEKTTDLGEGHLAEAELAAETTVLHDLKILDSVKNTRNMCDIVFHELRIADSVVITQMNCDVRRVLDEIRLAIVNTSTLELTK